MEYSCSSWRFCLNCGRFKKKKKKKERFLNCSESFQGLLTFFLLSFTPGPYNCCSSLGSIIFTWSRTKARRPCGAMAAHLISDQNVVHSNHVRVKVFHSQCRAVFKSSAMKEQRLSKNVPAFAVTKPFPFETLSKNRMFPLRNPSIRFDILRPSLLVK